MKTVTIDGVSYELTSEDINVGGHDIDESTTCDACYGEIEDGAELMIAQHINIENEQKLGYGICHCSCAADTDAEKYLAHTDSHYDWTSETSTMFDAMRNAAHNKEDDGEYAVALDKIASEYLDRAGNLTHSSRDVIAEALQNVADARISADYYR